MLKIQPDTAPHFKIFHKKLYRIPSYKSIQSNYNGLYFFRKAKKLPMGFILSKMKSIFLVKITKFSKVDYFNLDCLCPNYYSITIADNESIDKSERLLPLLITRETDYAIRILRALRDGEKYNMTTLCKEQDIPQQFAYKILRKLSEAGIVTSTRGANGGCRLSTDLKKLSLLDLIRIIDPDKPISSCLKKGYQCAYREAHCDYCGVHDQLIIIQNRINKELAQYNLYDILNFEEPSMKKETSNAIPNN